MCFHGTEYRLLPTLTWMSGPTLHRDHSASTNGLRGSGAQVRPSRPRRTPRPGRRRPAAGTTAARPPRAHQRSALGLHLRQLVNSRPRQNESRIYGIGRSTCALSRGFRDRAGSTRQP